MALMRQSAVLAAAGYSHSWLGNSGCASFLAVCFIISMNEIGFIFRNAADLGAVQLR